MEYAPYLKYYERAIRRIEYCIHILCVLSPNLKLSELVQKIKANSSRWMKQQGEAYEEFYWRRGYAVFFVNYAQLDMVIRYIEKQEVHHKKKPFPKGYIEYLEQHDLNYNEQYIED